MSIFAIGDLHLSLDERIDKPMDIFGGAWDNHHIRLKEYWEQAVTDADTVLIPGDISWGLKLEEATADFAWIDELPGKKVITKGNHDLWWTGTAKLNQLFDSITFLQNDCYLVGTSGICVAGTRGWICPGSTGYGQHDEKMYQRELIRLELSLKEAVKAVTAGEANEIIAMLHYPPTNDKFQPSGFTDMLAAYGVKTCIYGHLHGKEVFPKGFQGILNGVEYKLVSLDYLECNPLKLRD